MADLSDDAESLLLIRKPGNQTFIQQTLRCRIRALIPVVRSSAIRHSQGGRAD